MLTTLWRLTSNVRKQREQPLGMSYDLRLCGASFRNIDILPRVDFKRPGPWHSQQQQQRNNYQLTGVQRASFGLWLFFSCALAHVSKKKKKNPSDFSLSSFRSAMSRVPKCIRCTGPDSANTMGHLSVAVDPLFHCK